MEKPLPVNMLSTRALGNSAREFIQHQGWRVDIVSFIETRGIISVEQVKVLMFDIQLPNPHLFLIFSSEKGVKWLKWGLDKYGFSLPAGLKALCVGEKTKKLAIEKLGIDCVFTANDAATLVSSLHKVVPADASFLFLCSNKHLNILPEGIKAAGFYLKEYIIYETLMTPHSLAKQYDVVFFFSPSAVDSFFMVNTWNQSMLAVCIGQTTSAALNNAGVERILVADHPSELSMMEVLNKFLND